MSGRYVTPIPGRIFAIVAATWLASWHVAPAFASSTARATCDEPQSASIEIPADRLHATNVSHEPDARSAAAELADQTDESLASSRYPAPEAEAAMRQVFEDGSEAVSEPPPDEAFVEDDGTRPAIKARVPGVSEGDLARYKRHMYRRDI